jgi:hypothetical protein
VTQAYPLSWPFGLARTEPGRRVASQFKTELMPALKNVEASLRRFGEATGKAVSSVVISSNYSLGVTNPADPGVAVWFLWDGKERCIAVDRYPRLQHNLQAIHHVLEARVTEARHGGLRIVQQTFTGFIALPAPTDVNGRTPAQVMGLDGRSFGRDDVVVAHRELAKKLHPDRQDGDGQAMADLNAARDALLSGFPA